MFRIRRSEFTSANTSDFVSFYINGELHEVRPSDGKFGPGSKLVDYIREEAKLTGTKFMCREGGCGACLVTVKLRNVSTGRLVVKAVNSCLIPVFSCDGWRISTVESLGNRKDGYSKIQQQLVNFGGTQCGYCTPGMIMNMNSLMEEKAVVKTKDIEDLLDGNICRCTGYRPILDAFKSLAADAPEELLRQAAVHAKPVPDCLVPSDPCSEDLLEELPEEPQLTNIWAKFASEEEWAVPTTIAGIFEAVQRFVSSGKSYRIVAGNTGTGVFKNDGPYKGFIDIINVAELGAETVDSTGVTLGANVTLTHTLQFLKRIARSQMEGFSYALPMSQHINRIANVPVRNVGTLAGNLMLKHNHQEFPSDIFLMLTTLNATLSIASSSTRTENIPMEGWLTSSMENKLIVSIHIPRWLDNSYVFRSFKISRRYQNAHPDVNAGFLFKISQDKNKTVIEKPNIVFGGITSSFVRASKTEAVLIGKSLKDVSTLQEAMKTLEDEIQPSNQLPDASPEYRKALTQSLLYKTILQIVGVDASSKNQSGSKQIKKGKTKGKQVFDMDKSMWPLNKPVAKIEAAAQCSGEAVFISDILPQHRELFGAFVLSTIAKGDIESIDASEALKLPRVHAFIQAKDVPGPNNFMVYTNPEEIFCSGKIMYAGQSIGLVLGETRAIAFEAAKLVQVKYRNVEKPTLEPVLPPDEFDENWLTCVKTFNVVKGPERKVDDKETSPAETIVQGEFKFGGQYHFHMETQVCLCVPKEDHLRVYSATQWIDLTQSAIASALAIPSNEVQIEVKRIGGAYGAKICRATHVATACAVASKITNRPVRVFLDLQTNMELIGKRSPYTIRYKVAVDAAGRITNLKASVFAEVGSVINDSDIDDAAKFIQNCYDVTGWEVTKSEVLTDKAPNTFCRAPGTSQGIAMVEHLMEHIAFQLQKDPLEIRTINFIHDGSPLLVPYSPDETTFVGENKLLKMIERMKKSADYNSRTEIVSAFNKNNRWRKRGIAVVPIRYHLDFQGYKYPVYVAIYKNDGTVVVTHGGIEMGQGINTKVAQTVAYKFSIPIEKIRITASNNIIGANADLSGASVTSELCCYAATVACQILLDRMKPVKDQMKNPTWEQLIATCGKVGIDLTASHMYSSADPVKTYDIWGLTVSEVEIDCLTGEYRILRVDLTEDAGRSLNPEVDIGQIEGAFVMAIGWWTTENLVHDSVSGKLLTNGTWEYKPPTAADIPTDFRVTLLRKSPNPFGVLRSKATGEPPLCMGISVLFALRHAIYAARRDAGVTDYVSIDGPLTQEKILINCLTNPQKFDI
ncbi:unnamed protein product [Allacma fusca]|uniref:Indole-3-acetaldehyde oxidase n=1 Tax=Allacma fusca TaxID=39272 RepID=A0A8J2LTK1_9HEXA|nr:unnamed protein product [Allacma fusca]